MLVRILLALRTSSQYARFRKLLSQRRVLVSQLPPDAAVAEHLQHRTSDLVLVECSRLPEGSELAPVIASIRALPEHPEVVALVRSDSEEQRTALLSSGVMAVVSEKLTDEALAETLGALVLRRREDVQRSLGYDRLEGQGRLSDFVSESPTMAGFMEVVARVVQTNSSLLILGETGVGKERLARAIHFESPRARAPFLAVNCAAMPEALLESELFGHEEGAFTGATRPHRGCFELAHGGTIFLDEIGEMPTHLQVKLLRVLQDRRIQPVGGETPVGVDVRIMAATNRDLAADLRSGRFRTDLYYRIGVVTLTVPPLRERVEDVPALVASYIDHFRARATRRTARLSPEAMEAMQRYTWPGNVRELINVIERAMLLCDGPEITLADLPQEIRGASQGVRVAGASGPLPRMPDELEPWRSARARAALGFERAYFSSLLRETGGRVGAAARRAQIDPRSLFDKLKRLAIRKEDFLG